MRIKEKIMVTMLLCSLVMTTGCSSREDLNTAQSEKTTVDYETLKEKQEEKVKRRYEEEVRKNCISLEVKEKGEDAYQKAPKCIDFFCENQKVRKEDLQLGYIFEKKDGKIKQHCYEIQVLGEEGKTGRYIFCYDEKKEQVVLLAKYMSEVDVSTHYYEVMYDKDKKEIKNKEEYQIPTILTGKEYEYEETLTDTDDIWECYNGYVNEQGEYATSYYGDTCDWEQGVFRNEKWKVKAMEKPKHLEDYYCDNATDGSLWYYNDKVLKVWSKDGKTKWVINISDWKEKNDMKGKGAVEITPLVEHRAIFTVEGKDSYLVNLKNGEIEFHYPFLVQGECFGKNVCQYNGSEEDLFQLVNWKTGKVKCRLNLSDIRYDPKGMKNYICYSLLRDECYFYQVDHEEINNAKKAIDCCMYEDELYFSSGMGVYRYDEKENVLVRILDGDKYSKYRNMFSDFDVGKDEHIYMLGYYGFGDDEGATDFLYLTKKD